MYALLVASMPLYPTACLTVRSVRPSVCLSASIYVFMNDRHRRYLYTHTEHHTQIYEVNDTPWQMFVHSNPPCGSGGMCPQCRHLLHPDTLGVALLSPQARARWKLREDTGWPQTATRDCGKRKHSGDCAQVREDLPQISFSNLTNSMKEIRNKEIKERWNNQ